MPVVVVGDKEMPNLVCGEGTELKFVIPGCREVWGFGGKWVLLVIEVVGGGPFHKEEVFGASGCVTNAPQDQGHALVPWVGIVAEDCEVTTDQVIEVAKAVGPRRRLVPCCL